MLDCMWEAVCQVDEDSFLVICHKQVLIISRLKHIVDCPWYFKHIGNARSFQKYEIFTMLNEICPPFLPIVPPPLPAPLKILLYYSLIVKSFYSSNIKLAANSVWGVWPGPGGRLALPGIIINIEAKRPHRQKTSQWAKVKTISVVVSTCTGRVYINMKGKRFKQICLKLD